MLSVEAADGRIIEINTPPPNALYVSHNEVQELSFELWQQIHTSGLKFDTPLVIGRGGLQVGNHVLRLMGFEGKDFQHQGMSSYIANDTKRDGGRFQIGQRSVKIGGRWIVIDEVGETCESLAVVHNQLEEEHDAESVHSGVLHYKPTKVSPNGRPPDFYVRTTDKWVVYPWEWCDVIGKLVSEGVGELALQKTIPKIREHWQVAA